MFDNDDDAFRGPHADRRGCDSACPPRCPERHRADHRSAAHAAQGHREARSVRRRLGRRGQELLRDKEVRDLLNLAPSSPARGASSASCAARRATRWWMTRRASRTRSAPGAASSCPRSSEPSGSVALPGSVAVPRQLHVATARDRLARARALEAHGALPVAHVTGSSWSAWAGVTSRSSPSVGTRQPPARRVRRAACAGSSTCPAPRCAPRRATGARARLGRGCHVPALNGSAEPSWRRSW